MMEKLVLTVKETAEMLNLSVVTVYNLMKREEHPIPSLTINNNPNRKKDRHRIPMDALKRWIAEETEMTMNVRG